MKNALFLLLALPLFMTSCSKDDDPDAELHPIVGKWIVNNAYMDVETNKENVTEELKKNDNVVEYEHYMSSVTTYDIDKNNRLTIKSGGKTLYDGACKINKDIFKFTDLSKNGPIETRYTFTITDGVLTLSQDLMKAVTKDIKKYVSNPDDLADLTIDKIMLNLELSK